MWSELVIGSNRVINSHGVIGVDGEPQVELERGTEDMQLLLTMDLYNEGGEHVAKLRRNAWAFHGEDYDITTHPSSLKLIHRATSTVVAEAQIQNRDRIVVPNADFFLKTGPRIVVLPDALQVGGMRLSRNVFQETGSMLDFGSGGSIGIG